MRFREIFEFVQDDLSAHEKATAAFQRLGNHVYDSKVGYDFDLEISGRGEFYAIKPETVKLGFDDVCILLGLRKKHTQVMEGGIMEFNTPLDGKYNFAIVVYCMRSLSIDEMKSSVNSTGFMSTFEHEYVHVLDIKRTNSAITARNYGGDRPGTNDDVPLNRSQYYNDPAEFNAYFHTFGGDWLTILNSIKNSPDDAEDMKSLYGITGDFKKDLARLIAASEQSQAFFKYLSERNRKRIVQRLYQVYQEIVKPQS